MLINNPKIINCFINGPYYIIINLFQKNVEKCHETEGLLLLNRNLVAMQSNTQTLIFIFSINKIEYLKYMN
jgi:hypothetical protein